MSAGQSLTGAAIGHVEAPATAATLLDDLLSATPDPVLLVDDQNRLRACNRAAADEFDLASFTEMPLTAIPALRPMLDAPVRSGSAEPLWDVPSGKTYAVFRKSSPSGGAVITLRDVSDAQALNTEIANLMHIVSHDLRTPLTALKSYAEMLVDNYFGEMSREQQVALEKLTLSIYGMVSLVDNLQAADRFDPRKGLYKTERNPLDLTELARSLIGRLELPADIQGITLELDADGDVPIVRADSLMLECALANLLDNAMKFSPPESTVLVHLTTDADSVLISVTDQGRGIAPEDFTRIFDRSVRVETPGKTRVRGSGLGLFVVRSVAERHGGSVWVESTLGQGSTFTLKLPVRGEATGG
jgi:signal transduction histidine kinase